MSGKRLVFYFVLVWTFGVLTGIEFARFQFEDRILAMERRVADMQREMKGLMR